MNPIEPTKEAYAKPEAETICIAPMFSIVEDISNPSGTTDPLDPEEG